MTPARKIIEKCGGAHRVAELVGYTSVNSVYRWHCSKDAGGRDGQVPSSARRKLLDAAKQELVAITPADFEEGWQ